MTTSNRYLFCPKPRRVPGVFVRPGNQKQLRGLRVTGNGRVEIRRQAFTVANLKICASGHQRRDRFRIFVAGGQHEG